MLKLKKIAVTGGIASGKSTVCQLFRELGAYVVSADALVHELLQPDTPLGKKLPQQFGNDLLVEGKISRQILAQKVFGDPEKLGQLEALLHPRVRERTEEEYQKACREGGYTSFVAEIPLLFEVGGERFYDVTIALLTDPERARERVAQRNLDYDLRMKRQLPPEEKAKRAHYTLFNNGSMEDLKQRAKALYHLIQHS